MRRPGQSNFVLGHFSQAEIIRTRTRALPHHVWKGAVMYGTPPSELLGNLRVAIRPPAHDREKKRFVYKSSVHLNNLFPYLFLWILLNSHGL